MPMKAVIGSSMQHFLASSTPGTLNTSCLLGTAQRKNNYSKCGGCFCFLVFLGGWSLTLLPGWSAVVLYRLTASSASWV